MKTRNLLFILLIFSLGISLFSCNFGDTGNTQTFQNTPAVVDWRIDMDGTVICTPWGYFSAPSLYDVSEGNCLFVYQFTIDYDNQPSDKYYTASNIVKETVNQAPLIINNSIEADDYVLVLSNVNTVSDEFLLGRFFIEAICKDKNPSLRLIYNSTEEEPDGIKNLYLQVKPSSSTENVSDVSTIQAFNLLSFIRQYGEDTTKTFKGFSEKYDFKFIKVNLKYVSEITDGTPTYSTVNNSDSPIEIYVFKNNY